MGAKIWLLSWGLVFLSAFLDAVAIYFIKHSLNTLGPIPLSSFKECMNYFISLLKNPMALGGFFAYAASPFLWLLALSRLEVSIAYPLVVTLHLFFATIVAFFFLGEQVTTSKILAVVLIMASVLLLYVDHLKS